MRSHRSLKVSHTQTSVPCGTLNYKTYNDKLEAISVYKTYGISISVVTKHNSTVLGGKLYGKFIVLFSNFEKFLFFSKFSKKIL